MATFVVVYVVIFMSSVLITGITGQDGSAFASADEAAESANFPGDLAGRIFAANEAVTNVFVASNQVVLERTGGWDEATADASATIVANFFVFYAD